MKQKIKIIALSLCLLLPQFAKAQQAGWDAATCIDICKILVQQGSITDEILVGEYGYKLVNNFSGDFQQGYVSLYTLNLTAKINGDIISLGKSGVSNYLMVSYDQNDNMMIATSFFNANNAAKFRQQAINAGFKKTRTVKGETYYKAHGIEMMETPAGKFGRFTLYGFTFKLDYD